MIGADRGAPLVVVCEHASHAIPADLDNLGLDDAARLSHIAWDIGALDVAMTLAKLLDAPLVVGTCSRLVYDLNRPQSSASAIPARSETFDIPGNLTLSDTARQARFDRIYTPFHDALAATFSAQETRAGTQATLLTVHSFTPVFMDAPRRVELGFLHHDASALAIEAAAIEDARGIYRAAVNAPYGPDDGVTHTLERHGDGAGRPALMIEIRNDLIDTPDAAIAMAHHLAPTLDMVLADTARKAAP